MFVALRFLHPRRCTTARFWMGLSLFCGKTGNHQCMLRHIRFRKECLKQWGWKVMSSKLAACVFLVTALCVPRGNPTGRLLA